MRLLQDILSVVCVQIDWLLFGSSFDWCQRLLLSSLIFCGSKTIRVHALLNTYAN